MGKLPFTTFLNKISHQSWCLHTGQYRLSTQMKGPREEPEMSQNFSSGVNRMWCLLTSHSFHRDMFRGKNRLSPPEDAVDERLSHGKTGSVHLRTPLMKGSPMEKPDMSWPYFGRTGDVHNFANVTSPVLPLNPSNVFNHSSVNCV